MEIAPLQRHVVASDIQPERLAGNAQLSQQQKIGEASRQFESILLKQILDSSQKTVIKSKYADNSTSSSIYHDMVTNQLADSISKSGALGLAKTFDHQLNRPHHGAALTAGNEPAAASVSAATATPIPHATVTNDRPKTRAEIANTGGLHHTTAAQHNHLLHAKRP